MRDNNKGRVALFGSALGAQKLSVQPLLRACYDIVLPYLKRNAEDYGLEALELAASSGASSPLLFDFRSPERYNLVPHGRNAL
jgi:hypothetical protein